ncbi:hypothetical protein RND71_001830 [Anisodus tanguticus]|uniref:Uncharacterized protein n=1 Tax=Anisodus tanguticus TaxID=243964 RepID=A0AAE1T215_9SOLA|nr:hypothetical protein RND71_001830 [Anisodus tanguticus]
MTSRKRKVPMDDVPNLKRGQPLHLRVSWNGLKGECPGIILKLKKSRWDCFAKPPALDGPILPPTVELFSTQPRVSTEPCVDHSPEKDDVEEDDDDDDKLERQSESEPDIDVGDEELESIRSIVRETCVQGDEVDTVIATQRSVEELR